MELPAVRRTQPIPHRPKFLPTTHVQLLQWLHGKQQQQHTPELLFLLVPGNRCVHQRRGLPGHERRRQSSCQVTFFCYFLYNVFDNHEFCIFHDIREA